MPNDTRGGGAVDFTTLIETVGQVIDLVGVLVIAGGLVLVTLYTVPSLRVRDREGTYGRYRRRVGKVILLGLEFLIAADIIRTVAVEATFEGVTVLGLIVLVRTFLSFSLEVELYGRWPWQRRADEARDQPPSVVTPEGER